MGRHSSPEQGHFYRSFFGWVTLWATIAVVTGIAVWFVVGAVGGPEAGRPVIAGAEPGSEDTSEDEVPVPTVSGALITKEDEPEETPSPTPTTDTATPETKLITKDVSVQVLDGTTDPRAAQTLADKLTGLGFAVIALEESSRIYEHTTVFWSTETSKEAATALAERFGWIAESKPANLSDTVSFHVVVGKDEV